MGGRELVGGVISGQGELWTSVGGWQPRSQGLFPTHMELQVIKTTNINTTKKMYFYFVKNVDCRIS